MHLDGEELAQTLSAFQTSRNEMKSKDRDDAKAMQEQKTVKRKKWL